MTLVFHSTEKAYLKELGRAFRTTRCGLNPPLVMEQSGDYLMNHLPGPVIRLSTLKKGGDTGRLLGTAHARWLGNGYYHVLAPLQNQGLDNRGGTYWAFRAALLQYCKLSHFFSSNSPVYVVVDPFGSDTGDMARYTARQMHNAMVDVLFCPPYTLTDGRPYELMFCDARPPHFEGMQ